MAYKQTSTPCRQLSSSALSFVQRPDGEQHCYDHDGSGGMRKSGYGVDDAGDASNAEIGHVPTYLLERYIAITPRVRPCRIRGLLGRKRESGERTLAGKRAIG